jgi:predicted nucleotidyltransferase
MTMNTERMAIWECFLERVKGALISHYRETLLAAVIFGSAARGDFRKGSDLDLLIILAKNEDSLGKRIDEFMGVEGRLRELPEYARAKEGGFPHRIEPVVLDQEEFQKHPPLLLDLTIDAKVLVDREDVFSREMEVLRRRLQELGSRKVVLKDGRWYWVLKPGMKWGEQVIL